MVPATSGRSMESSAAQAACAVLDYRTGELKAIVGARTKVTARKTLNRATDMKMPVGSSIKPISVYAPALVTSIFADAFDGAPQTLTLLGRITSAIADYAAQHGFRFEAVETNPIP